MPTLDLAVAINEVGREGDEWFDESDDLERLRERSIPLAMKSSPWWPPPSWRFELRTPLLLARWLLDHNGVDSEMILRVDDEAVGDLLVKAASGVDVEAAIIERLRSRE